MSKIEKIRRNIQKFIDDLKNQAQKIINDFFEEKERKQMLSIEDLHKLKSNLNMKILLSKAYIIKEIDRNISYTRLGNLLRNYRDHMITNYASKYKYLKITEVIEIIDDSIQTLNLAMY